MTKLAEIYRCAICGNIVEVLHTGAGELVCCGQPMGLLQENTVDAATEKHVPIVEIDGHKVKVLVGSVPHPMQQEHYIEWIELLQDGKILAACALGPGDEPEAQFYISNPGSVKARALCNLHGLWSS